MQSAQPKEETLSGIVGRFIYRAESFAIFKLDNIVALGELVNVREGDRLTLTGRWEQHPKYGRQFRVTSWEKPVPSTREAAVAFLSSGLIKGIGPATAEKIIKALGPEAVRVILNDPDALKKIKGIGKKAPEIVRQLQETYQVQRVVADLMRLGLTCKTAMKAYKAFGFAAADYVRQNPYCLTKLDLIGFHKADEIAIRMGLSPSSAFRIQAALRHVLNEALWNEGHTCLLRETLIARALELLNRETSVVASDAVEQALRSMDETTGDAHVSLSWAARFEKDVACDVKRLAGQRFTISPLPKNLVRGITLTADQENAVYTALTHGLCVLTGGPGVGKTQTVRAVIEAFRHEDPFGEIVLCAPTGRAARRLSELTEHPAHTVHKLLGLREDAALFNRENPLRCGLLVVDESSMLNLITAKRLLETIPDNCRVLLVGDADQLPAVGPGNILRDLLDQVPTVRLTQVFRQAAESQIVANAHRINRGQMIMIDRYKGDFTFLERNDPEDIARSVADCVNKLPYNPMEIQVLSPMKKGPVGTVALNRLIQGDTPGVRFGPYLFRVGDKVIHTKNNYDKGVMNGDIGLVRHVAQKDDSPVVHVQYNGDLLTYDANDLHELEPAWAITVHRAQGSEFKAVIVPVTTSHYVMLYRNLFYTAITRAREKLILVGTRKALALAIRNNQPVQRHTMLRHLL